MNVFIVGWGLTADLAKLTFSELKKLTEIYPELEARTLWKCPNHEKVFVGSIQTAYQAALPRRYVWEDKNIFTLYSGTVVDSTNRFFAHDAKNISENWDYLPEILEGQFVLIRVDLNSPSMEVVTDILAQEQVYFWQQGDKWLVSNSVGLLDGITKSKALDPLGISLFLTMGWAGADRTLRRDIQVIPPGQHWKWGRENGQPSRFTYFPQSRLVQPYQKKISQKR